MRALGLISGGWDGEIAAAMVRAAGWEVLGLHLDHGFVRDDRAAEARRPREFPVEVRGVAREFLAEVVRRPRHGYGSAMNPCIDCRIFMLRRAAAMAEERGIGLVFTGEVLGQTRMSQRRESLLRIEAESGLSGRLLRPLSARFLEPTRAETGGAIDRDRLGAIHGRGRREQARLSAGLGLPPPRARGGPCCLLADRAFAARLRDLLAHSPEDGPPLPALALLRRGRHFRLSHRAKAVVARDEEECRLLRERHADLPSCQAEDGRGPVVLLEGDPDETEVRSAAALALRFGAHRGDAAAPVRILGLGPGEGRIVAAPASAARLEPI